MAQSRTRPVIVAVEGNAGSQMKLPSGPDFVIHRTAPDLERGTWPDRPPDEADAIVIDAGVRSPLATARRLRRDLPRAQIVFLVPPDRRERFHQMLPFTPDLGDAWTASSTAAPAELHELLLEVLRVGRERRETAALLQHVNRLIERPETADEPLRREARTILAQSYMSGVLSQAPDPIFALTPDGRLLAWNDATEALLGRAPGAVEETRLLDSIGPVQHAVLREALAAAAAGRAAHPLLQVVDRAGVTRDLELHLTRVERPEALEPVLACVVRDVTARRQAEMQLREALAEKELLLRELHHRVKNNLQVVSSYLTLRSQDASPELRTILRDTVTRIQALAHIHAQLSPTHDPSHIDLTAFVTELGTGLLRAYGLEGRIAFSCDLGWRDLRPDAASPVALILAEAISNALKHAFVDERSGTLQVTARQEGGGLVIEVRDDGIGITQRPDSSLGIRLMDALARQLRAKLDICVDGGTVVTLRLPADHSSPA